MRCRTLAAFAAAALLLLSGCGHGNGETSGSAASVGTDSSGPAVSSSAAASGSAASGSAGESSGDAAAGTPAPGTEAETPMFPKPLENGALEVTSLFSYSGINPDCGDEMGENIGSLEVANRSGRYLEKASLTVRLTGGGTLHFTVHDLPAGAVVWVFDRDNTPLGETDNCKDLTCDAAFSDGPALPEQMNVATEGSTITLLNGSGSALKGYTAVCHMAVGEMLFGGVSFSYSLDTIPAGGSVQFQANECYLGEVSVARVSRGG